jgi:hypothetical protein
MTPSSLHSPSWQDVRLEFEADGSYRDIYVFNASLEHWQNLLDWARRCDPGPIFTVDGAPSTLPALIHDVFAGKDAGAPLLSFRIRDVEFAAHFFQENEIELDFDPASIRGDNWTDFVAGLTELAELFGKEVVVTPENHPDVVVLRISHDDVTYYPASAG